MSEARANRSFDAGRSTPTLSPSGIELRGASS